MLRSVTLLWKIFLFLNFITFTTCQGSYTITAPGTIRSNRKYTVCATLHNADQPAKLLIGIRHNSTWSDRRSVLLQPFETKMLDFYPPKLDLAKKYELFAEGVQGLNFSKSTQLLVGESEGVNIYIETDRGTYKPGDTLHFRIVILDEHARPVRLIEPIKIQIFDSEKNRVKQFKDVPLDQGVYVNQFQIAKEPVLGSWSIKVFVGGRYAQERSAEFEIAKYVLPKFFINIETENNFYTDDRFLKVKVDGRYTYNKPVEGKVTLRIRQKEHGFTVDLANFATDTLNNEAVFNVDLDEIKDIIMSNRLILSASLTEKQTNILQTATKVIYLQREAFNISILYDEMEIKNGKIFRLKAKIAHWNNTIVKDSETCVFMKRGNKTFETKLNDYGVATFENELDENDSVIITYKNSSKWFYMPMYSGVQTLNSNCDLKIKNKSSRLNSPIDILVEFKRNIPYLVYIVTSHGNIIENKFVHVEGYQKTYIIQLLPSNEMVPVSFLYVYYMYAGFLTYCEIKIELPEKLENEFSVSAPENVRPGDNITMTLNSQPGSRIAITAIDLSSMLINVGNRIKKADILQKMREDISYSKKGYVIFPGVISGLVTLTDIPYKTVQYLKEQSIPTERTEIANNVRSYFPETWIFFDFNATSALTTINFTLPDTITTWVVTAFSMSETTGIGLLDKEVTITAIKNFFISVYLPYSIKRSEIVSVLVMISNYHSESLCTEVIMENSLNEFQFVDSLTNKTTKSLTETRTIIVPANNGKSVTFLIKAQKLGHIAISVAAKNKLSSDKVLQKLLVEADGLEVAHNHELYIQLKPGQNYTTRFEPNIPTGIESDSEFMQLSISGDVLLPSFENLDNLIDKPTGCGEQNMINFAPNILVLEYLSAICQTSKYAELVRKAEKYTEIGYQQQLKFRHANGGYSVFGPERSKTPSNWLTAYVARFFIKALKYIPIETHIIESSLKYLADGQLSSGEFSHTGYLFHAVYQSPSSFTAFVLLSFLENAKYAKKYKNTIQKSLNFLSNNLDETNDVYSLAIMAVVFQISKHERASDVLNKLKPYAKTKNDLQWWHDSTDDGTTDIEITSYVLLALLHTPGHYLPIAKWLMEQRNSHGGFQSSQDTVVGLQAMIKFAQLTAVHNDTVINVSYKALNLENKELENRILSLDSEHAMILQHNQLPPSTRSVDIEISGTGSIFLQFFYNYRNPLIEERILANNFQKSFVIKKKAELIANGLTMNLEICIQYKPLEDVKYLKTNMVIAEVDLPSGYIAKEENIRELRSSEDIERIENERPDKIIFYFTYVEANDEKCMEVVADNKHDVKNLKPSKIVVYEYYHSDRREVVTYKVESNKILDS